MNARRAKAPRAAAAAPHAVGDDELIFIPLGGAGEIGMNLNLFGYRGRWLMVDCGVTFGNDETPGIDVIMPDPAFIAERARDLDGLVLTHAHEDHIGAVPYLWPRLKCPLYATPFTAAVLRRKLADVGLEGQARIKVVAPGSRFKVGQWDIEMVTLTHSIPEPNALVIRTPHGALFHTGDWKIDPSPLVGPPIDEAGLRRLGDEGVLALVGDSTNVFRAGVAGSEAEVRKSLIDLAKKYDQRVAIACFASNVARLETVAAVAAATGREAALVGRSLWRIYEAARECGYLRDVRPFLSEDDVADIPRARLLMAVTGSQGEPRAALARIAEHSHRSAVLEAGDVVIFSSRIIPGNERAIGRLQDRLALLGVEVVTERDHFVHVSGHPARDELVQMYQWTRPRALVPVHGELRHMVEHAKLARECQIADTVVAPNGSVVRLAPGPLAVVDEVPSGRLALDGTALVPLGGTLMKDRRKLMFNGAAAVTVVLDKRGRLAAPARVTVQGLADDEDAAAIEDAAADAVEAAVRKLGGRAEDREVEDAVHRAVRRAIGELRGKKPPTSVHVVRVH
jgi:ribonuclease J